MSKISGIRSLKKSARDHKDDTARGLKRGLVLAGLFLQRESQKIVPVDTGVLRASANTRIEGWGLHLECTVSYGTDYGIYVHEILENKHKPGKVAKFLEIPLRLHRNKVTKMVQDEVRKEQR